MPRATSTSTEEKTVKKAPRKRAAPKKPAATRRTAVRKTTTRKAVAKKATPRKTTIKKAEVEEEIYDVSEPEVVVEKAMSSTRKAPTKFAAAQAVQKSKRNQYIVIAILISLGVGASAAVGFSDSEAGQINVAQTIKERNERMANLVDVTGPTVVVPTPSETPDGGLIGLRPAEPATVPVDPLANASTTATSSDAAASTTTATSTATSTPAVDAPADQYATDTATTTVDAVDVTTADEQTQDDL